MPPKQRPSTKPAAQSTLSFNPRKPNRVTKPTSSTSRSDKAKKPPTRSLSPHADSDTADPSPSATTSPFFPSADASPPAPQDPTASTTSTTASTATTTESALADQARSHHTLLASRTAAHTLTPDEEAALRLPTAQLQRYWRAKEAARIAPRVHQERLSLHEKILREWDMSGQYGPCIGIARLKRWQRAQNMGLKPPVEVLAVLLREREEGNGRAERAYVDELMSSRFVET